MLTICPNKALGRSMNNGKSFSKISKPNKQDGAYICSSISRNCFRLTREWNANGKVIFFLSVPNRLHLEVIYNFQTDFPKKNYVPFHFQPKFLDSFCSTVSTLTFQKICCKLWKLYTTYRGSPLSPFWTEISLSFVKFSSIQSLISWKQLEMLC